ncbi:MAG: CapA family protein, partial [Muribaculaceae bacterium]|nr:CapA family protein [Muribaculaceae bacterium]
MNALFSTLLISLISLLSCQQEAEIVFAGDAMQHERQLKAARQADGTYDYSPYYRTFEPYIKSADFAVINLETTLGGKPYSGYPCFSAPDSYIKPIIDAGFDMVLLANNHMLDKRDKGLKRTVATLEAAGMPFIGAYADSRQRSRVLPMIRDIN